MTTHLPLLRLRPQVSTTELIVSISFWHNDTPEAIDKAETELYLRYIFRSSANILQLLRVVDRSEKVEGQEPILGLLVILQNAPVFARS